MLTLWNFVFFPLINSACHRVTTLCVLWCFLLWASVTEVLMWWIHIVQKKKSHLKTKKSHLTLKPSQKNTGIHNCVPLFCSCYTFDFVPVAFKCLNEIFYVKWKFAVFPLALFWMAQTECWLPATSYEPAMFWVPSWINLYKKKRPRPL